MTLQEAHAHWLEKRAPELRASTLKNYRSNWRALQRFHKCELSEITQEDVWKFGDEYKDRPVAAKRILTFLKVLYRHSEFWGLYPGKHPVRIKMKKEAPRTRRPSPEEAKRFWKVLEEFPLPFRVYITCTTKCATRVSEILEAKWEDLKPNGLWLPISKTKNGELIRFGPSVLALIESVPKTESPYIFKPYLGDRDRCRRVFWYPFRKKANLPGLNLQDLRRWSASTLVESGLEAKRVSLVLRHASVVTTERYLSIDESTRAEDVNVLDKLMG